MGIYAKRSKYDWLLEVLAVVGLLWSFWPLLRYGSLDEGTRIPVHFNAAGEVDGWGDKGALLLLPVIAILVYAGMTALEKAPKKSFNYPVKVTQANADTLHKLGVGLIRSMKVFMVFLFAYLNNTAFFIAEGGGTKLNEVVVWGIIAAMFVVIGIYLARMMRAK